MIYDYHCDACDHTFEDVKTIAERHTSTCPKCGGVANKLFTPTAVQVTVFQPYTTSHITGEPIEIRSPKHEKQVLDAHGIGIK